MLRDLGVVLQQQWVEVKAEGPGAGRLRHMATPTLWLQRLAINGEIKRTRVGGHDNCADLGTKRVDFQAMKKH